MNFSFYGYSECIKNTRESLLGINRDQMEWKKFETWTRIKVARQSNCYALTSGCVIIITLIWLPLLLCYLLPLWKLTWLEEKVR